MTKSIALLLMLLPFPALAGPCDRWEAGMEEDEGGSVMVARICAQSSDGENELSFRCGAAGQLSLRYIPAAPDNYPPSLDFNTDLKFTLDQDVFTRHAQYEDMDGAMATDIDIDAPMVGALQSRKQVQVADVGDKIPAATFPLKGSKAALQKLIAACSKP